MSSLTSNPPVGGHGESLQDSQPCLWEVVHLVMLRFWEIIEPGESSLCFSKVDGRNIQCIKPSPFSFKPKVVSSEARGREVFACTGCILPYSLKDGAFSTLMPLLRWWIIEIWEMCIWSITWTGLVVGKGSSREQRLRVANLFFWEVRTQEKYKAKNGHVHSWDDNCEHLVVFTSGRFLIQDKTW